MKNDFLARAAGLCLLASIPFMSFGQLYTRYYQPGEARQDSIIYPLNNIPVKLFSPGSLTERIKQDRQRDQEGRPFRFAKPLATPLGMKDGTWRSVGDLHIWQLAVKSKGALSLSLIFDKIQLSKEAELYIYNGDETVVAGPVDYHFNGKKSFGTDVFQTDHLIIEIHETRQEKNKSQVHISNVVHGYRDIKPSILSVQTSLQTESITDSSRTSPVYPKQPVLPTDPLVNPATSEELITLPDMPLPSAIGDSYSCNVDVNDNRARGWGDQATGVALILLNNNAELCTGCLVNNTRQDRRPFFLTAFHCFDANQDGVLQAAEITAAENARFRFHFMTIFPGNSSQLRPTVTYGGSTFRAGWAGTDFLLLELGSGALNRHSFLGWDSQNTRPPTGGVFVHHPQGDLMKFSLGNTSPRLNTATLRVGRLDYLAGRVWEIPIVTGGIQGGSSGAPIMKGADQNRLIYGQHLGGGRGCAGTNTINGAFHVSWNGNGTNATRLSNWLAPDDLARRELRTLSVVPAVPNLTLRAGYDFVMEAASSHNSRTYNFEYITPNGRQAFVSTPHWRTSFRTGGNGTGYYRVRARGINDAGTGAWTGWQSIYVIDYQDLPPIPPFPDPLSKPSEVVVFPNPSTEIVNVQAITAAERQAIASNNLIINSVHLIDDSGKTIFVSQVHDNEIHIPTDNFDEGTYIMLINHTKGVIKERLVIEK